MKLQLNEHTLNAYINEAFEQEINEGMWDRLARVATKKATAQTAKKTAPRVVGKAPRTKTPFNFVGNTKNAKGARLALRDFKNGKPLEMTVQGSKNASLNGKKFWVKKVDGKVRFFSGPECKAEQILTTEKGGLGAAARSSWNSELSHMKNILNSARRNMLGTGLVAGMGTGWAIDHAKNSSHPDDPWNAGSGDPGANGNNEDGGTNPGWDGTFPWDNTEPQWAPPRQRKNTGTTSTNVDTGTGVQSTSQDSTQQKREIPGAIQPTTRQLNIPTGAVARTQETLPRPTDDAFHKNVARNMLNTASLSAGDASQREKNSAIRQIAKNGIASTRSQNYDGLNPKGDREFIRNARNTILRGNQNPNI